MTLLVVVIVVALAFDFTNGFHDTANAVATSVSTRALSPRLPVFVAAGGEPPRALVPTPGPENRRQGDHRHEPREREDGARRAHPRDRVEPRDLVAGPAVELLPRADRRPRGR